MTPQHDIEELREQLATAIWSVHRVNPRVEIIDDVVALMSDYIDKQEAKNLSAIAYAIVYCQGTGHPCEYLESLYPELAVSDIGVTNKTN